MLDMGAIDAVTKTLAVVTKIRAEREKLKPKNLRRVGYEPVSLCPWPNEAVH